MERNINQDFLDLVSSEVVFTDVLIQTGQPVVIKTPKGWVDAPGFDPLHTEDMHYLLELVDKDWKQNIATHAISRAINLSSCRLRINAYKINGGTEHAVSVRRQALIPPPLSQIGVPLFIRTELEKPKGLIIVTGPTASGKTTTLASMCQYINATRSAHVVTIEDPIEYVHDRDKAIFSQKEVPTDVDSFDEGLYDALRQKPDVIMVGEIRDKNAADVVMLAAESGHLVLASMHTNSAMGAINKLLNWFPQEVNQRSKMLADSLLMVLCQSLIPTIDGKSWVLGNEVLMNSGAQTVSMLSDPLKQPQLKEFMKARTDKMSQTLNQDLFRLVRDSKISPSDAMKATNNKMELTDLLGALAPR